MSKGARRKKTSEPETSVSQPSARVVLFIPSRESAAQRSLREEVAQMAEARQWNLVVRRARKCRVVGGPEQGRPYDLAEPRDAAETYSAAHRNRVLVLATGACFVRRDPSAQPSRQRDLISLEGYVRYKAYFGMIRDRNDLMRHMEEFSNWPSPDKCSGPHDPRVLPLHIFDSQNEWKDLDDPKEAIRFAARFGPGGLRIDPEGRSWEQSAAFHGGDILTVAGYVLKHGFHWDVTRGRGKERIVTTHEVWKLYNRNSYCNIYPDGYVRVGRTLSGGSCRLVWVGSVGVIR